MAETKTHEKAWREQNPPPTFNAIWYPAKGYWVLTVTAFGRVTEHQCLDITVVERVKRLATHQYEQNEGLLAAKLADRKAAADKAAADKAAADKAAEKAAADKAAADKAAADKAAAERAYYSRLSAAAAAERAAAEKARAEARAQLKTRKAEQLERLTAERAERAAAAAPAPAAEPGPRRRPRRRKAKVPPTPKRVKAAPAVAPTPAAAPAAAAAAPTPATIVARAVEARQSFIALALALVVGALRGALFAVAVAVAVWGALALPAVPAPTTAAVASMAAPAAPAVPVGAALPAPVKTPRFKGEPAPTRCLRGERLPKGLVAVYTPGKPLGEVYATKVATRAIRALKVAVEKRQKAAAEKNTADKRAKRSAMWKRLAGRAAIATMCLSNGPAMVGLGVVGLAALLSSKDAGKKLMVVGTALCALGAAGIDPSAVGATMVAAGVASQAGSTLMESRKTARGVRAKLDPASTLAKDINELTQSSKFQNFTTVRFAKAPLGGQSLTGTKTPEELEVKAAGLQVMVGTNSGKWTPAIMHYVHACNKAYGTDVKVSASNCMLYESADKMDGVTQKAIALALTDAGWFTPCRGFAVRGELADLIVKDASKRFVSMVEWRSYMRSLISTPAQYVYGKELQGCPVFVVNMAALGWYDDDGGSVFTNTLMRPHQDRAVRFGDGSFLGIMKGFKSAAWIAAKLNADGSWEAVNISWSKELRDLAKMTINSAKQKPEPQASDWQFKYGDTTYSVGLFHDIGKAKGAGKDTLKTKGAEAKLLGNVGVDWLCYSIAQQNRPLKGKISFGWQVTSLVSEALLRKLFSEKGEARLATEAKIKALLGRQNAVFADLIDLADQALEAGVDSALEMKRRLEKANKLLQAMSTMGKRTTKSLSSGMGVKALAKHVQMIEMGGEFAIDHYLHDAPVGKDKENLWAARAFMGRTPNQMHDTIRAPWVLHVQAVATLIEAVKTNNLDAWMQKCPEQYRGVFVNFLSGIAKLDNAELRLDFLRALLPSVADGCMIVDSQLQKMLCGDNDGDQNMVSYNRIAVSVADDCVKQYPEGEPAKEQSKSQALPTFEDVVTAGPLAKGGFVEAYEAWRNGDNPTNMRHVAIFLNAPGNSPGQANVGGITQVAGSAHGLAKKALDGKYANPASRRFADFMYACQQPAIDRQKYYYIAASLLFWYETRLYAKKGNKGTRPGAMFEKGYDGTSPAYVIQGHYGLTFDEYKANWRELVKTTSEKVPMMGKLDENGAPVLIESANEMMYSNSGLYAFGAWQISACNFGLSYLSYAEMWDLAMFFKSRTEVNWEAVYDYLAKLHADGRHDPGVSILTKDAAALEAEWVWPSMTSGWQNAGYMEDVPAPANMRFMRRSIREIRNATIKAEGIDVEHTTFSQQLAESGAVEILDSYARGDQDIETADKFNGSISSDAQGGGNPVAKFSLPVLQMLVNSIYRAYVGAAAEEAAGVSQSVKSQTENISSNADRLANLRAALQDPAVATGLAGVNGASKALPIIRNALISGADKRMSSHRQKRVIAGVMAGMIRAADQIETDASALAQEKSANTLIEMIKKYGRGNLLAKMATWTSFRTFLAEETGGKASPDKKALKAKLNATWDVIDGKLRGWLTSLDNDPTVTLVQQALAEVDNSTGMVLIDFIAEDMMGALEEAWKNVDRATTRQSLTARVVGSFVALKDVTFNSVGDAAEAAKESFLALAQNALMEVIREDYPASATEPSEEKLAAHYAANHERLYTEHRIWAQPVLGAARSAILVAELMVEELGDQATVKEFWSRLEDVVVGNHMESVRDTDGTSTQQEVVHLNSIMSVPVPEEMETKVHEAFLLAGHAIQMLVQVPNVVNDNYGATDDSGYPLEGADKAWLTRKGYVEINPSMYHAAVAHFGAEKVFGWLKAQLSCGTGHVTTGEHLDMAYYGAGHDANGVATLPGFHAEDAEVIEVQNYFLSLYRENVVLHYSWEPESNEAKQIEELSSPEMADLPLVEWSLINLQQSTLYIPADHGSKMKVTRLVHGIEVDDVDENNEHIVTIRRVTPYSVLRTYCFGMVGMADQQDRMELPDEVINFQKGHLGFTIGAYVQRRSRNAKSGLSAGSVASYATRMAQQQLEAARAAESQDEEGNGVAYSSNLSKSDFENFEWSMTPALSPIEAGTKSAPSMAEVAKLGLLAPWTPDSWRWVHYPIFMSPSVMWNIVGAFEKDEDSNSAEFADINQRALRNIKTSSLRKLLNDIVNPIGGRMIESIEVVENPEFSTESYEGVIDLLASVSNEPGEVYEGGEEDY